MRPIRLLEHPHVFPAQFHAERAHGLIELFKLRGADDWRGHPGLVQQPRERHLRRRNSRAGGDFNHAIDDVEVRL